MCLRTLCISLAVVSSGGLFAQSQSERPQFRAGVELLQLDVVVLDNKRQPVAGLTAADFTVLDNGTETPIRAFTPIELARRPANEAVWAGEVAPDVSTNQIGQEEGRLAVILLDRTIPSDATVTARKIATTAVESLGPHDLAAVVSTNNSAVQGPGVQNLTADRARLLDAINATDPSTGMSATAEGIMNMPGSPFRIDPLNDSRCLCGLCVLETVTRVAEAVQHTPRRRKILLFIGSSMIWQSSRPIAAAFEDPGCESRLKDARGAMFTAIDRANLTVHSIDPQEMVNFSPPAHASPRAQGSAARVAGLQSPSLTAPNTLIDRESLNVLPDRTGGRAVVGRNNPEQSIPEIFRESASYYVIGVERATSARPDAARSLQVKVARKGLRVVAQRQYVATHDAATSAPVSMAETVDAALGGLLPSAGVPLTLAVTPFVNAETADSVLRVNVDAGGFARTDGAPVPLDVAIVAVDRTGKPVASARQTSTIAAARPTPGATVEVNVQSHLELPPGDYGLRVAIADRTSGKIASVFSDVTVPDFAGAPLSLSGMSVEVVTRAGPATTPSTRRTFKRGEVVRAILQIYQGTRRTDAPLPVAMRVRILDAKGTAVRDQSLSFPESAFTHRRTECVVTLPPGALTPGEYLLRLDATTTRHTAGRALRFSVQ